MYIIKNAFRCIARSKGRNILIGIIALVIAISACIGLSIRQAAEDTRASELKKINITATISYDRANAMNQISGGRPSDGGRPSMDFDKNAFADMMGSASSLTLEEYQKYAGASTVQDFYYTLTAYFNGSDTFAPVSKETEETEETEDSDGELEGSLNGGMPGFPGGKDFMSGMFSSGDFTLMGYSSDSAMTAFMDSNASIMEGGSVFDEGTTEYTCIISEELALYNTLVVGNTIVITNPSLETETYTLTVSGIYTSAENNDSDMSMFGKSQDPANRIYMSANALQLILDASAANSTTVTDDNGRESESKVTGSLSATYTFADPEAYATFEEEVRTLGLSDSYTVSSSNLSAYENKLAPLNTLSKLAGWFLLVILIIGGVILVVLNIFNVRERKYEVGVLTAMGMKKWKVATQFICEILVVTMIAVMIGAGVGAVSAVPVTNALLEGQVENQQNQQTQVDENFGRPGNMGGGFPGGMGGGFPGNMPQDPPENFESNKGSFENMFDSAADYIDDVNSAMNLTVVFKMIGVGLLLTLVASAGSVLFIMRYDPLKILSNRD